MTSASLTPIAEEDIRSHQLAEAAACLRQQAVALVPIDDHQVAIADPRPNLRAGQTAREQVGFIDQIVEPQNTWTSSKFFKASMSSSMKK